MSVQHVCCGSGAPLFTVDDLVASDPFFIGHRGAGDVEPEHTMPAYQLGAQLLQAIEVSTSRASDGVFVTMHDTNTLRTTGVSHVISATPWDPTLSELDVDMRELLGPETPLTPIPQLVDVLNFWAGRIVVFVEDKQGLSTTALLDLFDTYTNSTETIVWKTYRTGGSAEARARGYKVWGYLDDDDPNLAAVSAASDYLGVSVTGSDAWISTVVAEGKPVIAWPVRRRSERDRMLDLGVQGMMAPNLPYVLDELNHAPPFEGGFRDDFPSGRRTTGDLPWDTNDNATVWQPSWQLVDGEYVIELDHIFGQGYMLGSLCPTPSFDYVIEAELRFPAAIPTATQHVGLAFGRAGDDRYRFGAITPLGGYHLLLRGNGQFQLYRHDPDISAGTQLATANAAAPTVGAWVPIRVEVTAVGITATRLDTGTVIGTANTQYRGWYVHLLRNYDGGRLQFRNVSWTPL